MPCSGIANSGRHSTVRSDTSCGRRWRNLSGEGRTKAETRMEVISRSMEDQKAMLWRAAGAAESFEALSGQA